MFATLGGAYPLPEGVSAADGLRGAVADQLEAGLGLLGEGRLHEVGGETDVARVVTAWQAADAAARELAAEAGLGPPPVKSCLLGPHAVGWRASPSATRARHRATLASAEFIHEAVLGLFRAGAPMVQIDEPDLAQLAGATAAERDLARLAGAAAAERDLAAEAWRRVVVGIEGHLSLALPGGGGEEAGPELLLEAPFASYLFDVITAPGDWRVAARMPGDRGLVMAVADARHERPDTIAVMVWAARYAASLRGRGPERVGLAPTAGLDRLPRKVARAKLVALAEAARLASLSGAELAGSIDPLAVDARSAALGRWEPRPPRRPPS